ncbi:hypothetical protein C0J52_05545 [Blattella germanica]|nr:hypothetical protein C0J52_05545 [Blattella germanica]
MITECIQNLVKFVPLVFNFSCKECLRSPSKRAKRKHKVTSQKRPADHNLGGNIHTDTSICRNYLKRISHDKFEQILTYHADNTVNIPIVFSITKDGLLRTENKYNGRQIFCQQYFTPSCVE